MKYISEIKLTELVKNFMDDLDHTKGQQERKNKIFSLLYYFEDIYLKEMKKENESRKKYIEKLEKLIRNNTDFYGNDTELYQIWKGLKMEIR